MAVWCSGNSLGLGSKCCRLYSGHVDTFADTAKQENGAVVSLYVLMDDTPTIDVMWIFFVRFSFLIYGNFCVQKCRCASFFIVW